MKLKGLSIPIIFIIQTIQTLRSSGRFNFSQSSTTNTTMTVSEA